VNFKTHTIQGSTLLISGVYYRPVTSGMNWIVTCLFPLQFLLSRIYGLCKHVQW